MDSYAPPVMLSVLTRDVSPRSTLTTGSSLLGSFFLYLNISGLLYPYYK